MSSKNKRILKWLGIGIGTTIFLFVLIFPIGVGRFIVLNHKVPLDLINKNPSLKIEGKLDSSYFSTSYTGKLLATIPDGSTTIPFDIHVDIDHLFMKVHVTADLITKDNLILQKLVVLPPKVELFANFYPFAGVNYDVVVSPMETKATSFVDQFIKTTDKISFFINTSAKGQINSIEAKVPHFRLMEGILFWEIKNLIGNYQAKTDVNKGSYSLEGSLGEFVDPNSNFGPGIIHLSALNIDSKSLTLLKNLLVQMATQQNNPEAFKSQLLSQGINIFNGFMRHSPSFQVKRFRLQTKDGEVAGKLALGLEGGKGIPLFSLINKLRLEALLEADYTVAVELTSQIEKIKKIKQLKNVQEELAGPKGKEKLAKIYQEASRDASVKLEEYIKNQWVEKTPKGVEVKFKYQGGKTFLNGRQVNPFAALKGGSPIGK